MSTQTHSELVEMIGNTKFAGEMYRTGNCGWSNARWSHASSLATYMQNVQQTEQSHGVDIDGVRFFLKAGTWAKEVHVYG